MNVFLRILGLVIAASIVLSGRTIIAQVTPSLSVSVDSVKLRDVSSDRVALDLNVSVTSDTTVKTKQIQFQHMRMGSMPIYLSPITESLQIEKGVPLHLSSIPLTVFYRDLDSLTPLIAVVRNRQARVAGNAHVQLDLNFLERLVLRQWTPAADVSIAVTTPVEMPGDFLGQATALAALTAAQVAMDGAGSALSVLRISQKNWKQDLQTRYTSSIVIAESRYTVQTPEGRKTNFAVRGLGFRISADEFLLTDEVLHPWEYDVAVARAIESGMASVKEEGRDLLVYPDVNALHLSSARSLLRGQIRIESRSDQAGTTNVPTGSGPKSIKLLRRNSEKNYAVLRFNLPEDRAVAVPLVTQGIHSSESWERLAMFYLNQSGQLDLVSSAAHREGQRIMLDDPIDDRAFGSPLIASDGTVGMLQDERQGVALKAKW